MCKSKQLLDLNTEHGGNVGITGAIIPRDRNVAGIDIDTVVTPFGSIGLMVIDPTYANRYFIHLRHGLHTPVFTNIPGFGTVFVRDHDQDANAKIGKEFIWRWDLNLVLLLITARFKQ